ncbi:MAG: HutD family protein [Lachnospiraceae bacterium]|nr:HutD family protein [Lachnospiraceae bacterium]
MKHLNENDYKVSTWSGGKTTELAIAPDGAVYADRDFLWRLSSATVDLDESDFTELPDYDRLITPLDGVMMLTHNGGEPIELNPGDVDGFDGAWHTHSIGRCTDFNLMLRKGQCDGQITVLMPNAIDPAPQHFVPDPQSMMLMLYCAAGSAAIRFPESIEQLIGKEALLLEGDEITSVDLAISAGGCVVAAEIWSI